MLNSDTPTHQEEITFTVILESFSKVTWVIHHILLKSMKRCDILILTKVGSKFFFWVKRLKPPCNVGEFWFSPL
jgi:hypothetical protein